MKPKPPRRPRVAVGIIERHDNHVLIVLPSTPDDQTRLWQFPRGLANAGESPEQAMRRLSPGMGFVKEVRRIDPCEPAFLTK